MAEPSTVARPYAEAAFKLADGSSSLAKWSEMLAALATVSQDPRVRAAVGDPNLSDAKVAGLFISILSLSGEGENFIRVLAENGRLDLAQAEAVADLVEAETTAQRRQALAVTGAPRRLRIAARVAVEVEEESELDPDAVDRP